MCSCFSSADCKKKKSFKNYISWYVCFLIYLEKSYILKRFMFKWDAAFVHSYSHYTFLCNKKVTVSSDAFFKLLKLPLFPWVSGEASSFQSWHHREQLRRSWRRRAPVQALLAFGSLQPTGNSAMLPATAPAWERRRASLEELSTTDWWEHRWLLHPMKQISLFLFSQLRENWVHELPEEP